MDEKKIFSDNLNYYMSRNGKSQIDLINDLGVNKSTISTWCNGTKMPRMGTIQTLADYFGIVKSDLIEDRDAEKLPSNLIRLKSIGKVPILGRIACGTPILAVENHIGITYLPDGVKADFALECKGDSMIDANIFDEDIVYIREQPEVENGEIAAVLIGDEATLKRVHYSKGSLMLSPANSAHEPIILTKEEMNGARIIGKLVAVLRLYE